MRDFRLKAKKELSEEMTELKKNLFQEFEDLQNNCMNRSDKVLADKKVLIQDIKQEVLNKQKKMEEDIRMEFKREIHELRKDLLNQKKVCEEKEIIRRPNCPCECQLSNEEKQFSETESGEIRGSKDNLVFSDSGAKETIKILNKRKLGKLKHDKK